MIERNKKNQGKSTTPNSVTSAHVLASGARNLIFLALVINVTVPGVTTTSVSGSS